MGKDKKDMPAKRVIKKGEMKKAESKAEKGKMIGGEKGHNRKMTPAKG